MSQLENIEQLILKFILVDEDYFKLVTSVFEKEFFDNNTIGESVKLSGDYYQKYNKIPPIEHLKSNVSNKEELNEVLTESKLWNLILIQITSISWTKPTIIFNPSR
jgi:hypothetical protein